MAEEKGETHLSFSVIFYKEPLLTSLFPLVFAAAWYFPKLSAFLTACSPCFLHYFPRRFKQAELLLLLFFNLVAALQLVQRGQLSKQQRDSRDCLFALLLSEVAKVQTRDGGQREDIRVQTGFLHTGEGRLFRICFVSACCLCISLHGNTQHCHAGLPRQKGQAAVQLWLKKSLLAISDRQRKGEAHVLLFAFA